MRVDRRVRVRDLWNLDVEPIVSVEPEAKFVLDGLAPFLSGASSAAVVDDAFGVGFEFNTHVVEAALVLLTRPFDTPFGPISLRAGSTRRGFRRPRECSYRAST